MCVKRVTPKESEIMIEAYERGLSGKEAAAICGKATRTFYGVLRRAGKEARPIRKYSLDESFFDVIDSEEKAYWLGFISADGCVTKNSIVIEISDKDEEHLEKLLVSLKSNYNIYEREVEKSDGIHRYVSVSINSKKMVNSLYKLGVSERKSLTIKPPLDKLNGLDVHYWRGVFDGDGGMTFPRETQGKGAGAISVYLVGSYDMVDSFSKFISNKIETKAQTRKHESIFRVTYSGNALPKKVIKYMYSNSSIFLDRKKILADKALSILVSFWRCWDMTEEEFNNIYSRVGTWKLVASELKISQRKLSDIKKHLKLEKELAAVT